MKHPMTMKNPNPLRTLACCILHSAFCLSVAAQTTAFTYQGRLDDNGSPASGIYDLTFRLHTAVNGGLTAGTPITNTAVVVSNGLFTALLDFGGAPFSSQDRWLSIGVRTNGGGSFVILDPRQPITPTPLAIIASKVPDDAITGRMIADGEVTTLALQDGAVTTPKLATEAVTGAKLAVGAVESRHILSGAVTTTKLGDDAVTLAKLADDSVGTRALADKSVDLGALQDGVVTTAKLADAAVSSRKLASGVTLGFGAGVAGQLSLNSSSDLTTISLDADYGIRATGPIRLVDVLGGYTNLTMYRTAEGAVISVQQTTGLGGAILSASAYGSSVQLLRDNGLQGSILGTSSLSINQPDGHSGISAIAYDTGGIFIVRNADGNYRVQISGDDGNGAGEVSVHGDDGDVRARLEVYPGAGTGGILRLFSTTNPNETFISADGFSRINSTLGLGRDALVQVLEVEGNASKSVAGAWLANSDRRIKTNVKPVTGALGTLGQIRPVTFHYRRDYLERHPTVPDVEYYNVIAQEFAEVFPEAVGEGGDTLPSGENVLQVDTHPAMITALAAIQELHALVRTQEQRIAELERRLRANPSELNTAELAQKGQ